MKSSREPPIFLPQNFDTVMFSADYLPLPSEEVLEALLHTARCGDPWREDGRAQDGSANAMRKDGVPDVEILRRIRSWLILYHPAPPRILLCEEEEDMDTRMARVTKSIHLLASALLLQRCWYHVVETVSATASSDDPKQEISVGLRYILSDVIQAMQSALPRWMPEVSRDGPRNAMHGAPPCRKKRRPTSTDAASLAWREPHLIDWSLRRAMDQFLFPGDGAHGTPVSAAFEDVLPSTKSCYNCYQHFVRTFWQVSEKEQRQRNVRTNSATGDTAEENMVLLLLRFLQEIRLVVQQSIEAYNDFRSLFCAVFDAPEALSYIPLQQRITVLLSQRSQGDNECCSDLEEHGSSLNPMYRRQKRLLDLAWKLSLHARWTLPPSPRYGPTEYCRARAMVCSAASIAGMATLLLLEDGAMVNAEETSDMPVSSATPFSRDSIWDVILKKVHAFEVKRPSHLATGDSQSSLEEEEASNMITTQREVQIAVCALLRSILSALEYSDQASNLDETTTSSQLQAFDDASRERIVSSFASVVPALCDLSIGKASTIPYFLYIDQTAIPVDCFADALGCNDADFNATKSSCVDDDNESNLPAHLRPSSSQKSCNGDKSFPKPLSLFVDKLSQATAVLATIEKVESLAMRCDATPIVVTDDMELTEWAMSTTFVKDVHPSTQLLAMLDEYTTSGTGSERNWQDIVYPIINRTLLRLSQECDKSGGSIDGPVTVITTGSSSGYVQMRSETTADMQLCKAIVALYYLALEAILYCDKVQSTNNALSSIKKHVGLESFHQSLLACSCLCVTKANALTKRLRASTFMKQLNMTSILSITGSGPYEFLKVSSWFLRSLTANSVAHGKLASPLISTLPVVLSKHIEQVEIHTIDSLLWLRNKTLPSGTSFTDKILEFQKKMDEQPSAHDVPCLWPPNVLAPKLQEELEDAGVTTYNAPTYPTPDHPEHDDFCAVGQVIQKMLLLARNRLVAICQQLQVHLQSPVFTQVWVTFRHLLRNHVELFFDRHIDQWILCTLYGVSRSVKYQPELKFAKIIEAYVAIREQELGPIMCQRIVRHIRITAPAATDEGMGNIISLYNKIFVPKMKDFLLNSESLRRCTTKLASLQHK